MKKRLTKRTILKLTNPLGPVIIKGRRFERNTLGQGARTDSIVYSCDKWAMRDLNKYKKESNLMIEVIKGEY